MQAKSVTTTTQHLADVLPAEVWVFIFGFLTNDDERLTLGLASTQFRSYALAALTHVRLKGIRCHGRDACKNALELLHERCPGLRSLCLPGSSAFNDDMVKFIPSSVTALDLFWCSKLTFRGFAALPTNLRRLDLTDTQITNDALPLLPKSLHTLILCQCPHISNEGILSLRHNTNLHWLDVSGSNVGLQGLVALPPDLRKLVVGNIEARQQEDLEILRLLPQTLKFFTVRGKATGHTLSVHVLPVYLPKGTIVKKEN